MDTVITYLTLSFIVSFLLGSIPWGVIVSKLAFHKDIRDEGSGNIGTTNAFRAMGKVGGALVFVLDFGKGLLSGWLAAFVFAPAIAAVPVDAATPDGQLLLGIFGNPALNPVGLALAVAFAGCTLGHIFSPWLKFKGGKGIAVAAACLWFVFGAGGFHRDRRVRPRHRRHPLRVRGLHRRGGYLPAARPVLLLGPVGTLAHHRCHGLRRHLGPPRQHRPPARGHGEQDREQEDSLSINHG